MVVGGRELIDTLWNVNKETMMKIYAEGVRINRYIMECKSKEEISQEVKHVGINRYIMECK